MDAIYPGSFDPVTLGHIDIIKRAAAVFDRVTVGVLENIHKSYLFSAEERVEMISECVKDIKNVSVKSFTGLAVDFAVSEKAGVIVKGIRNSDDLFAELTQHHANSTICPETETVFLPARAGLLYVSSSAAKELWAWGAPISDYLPPLVCEKMREKLVEIKK